ncbi:MAG: hypothetical protein BWX45_00497 [Deltaproteobacteria bacterium ADurb.Bin002]|nr:MAG: hypothetical protein BWX45_00497 [Deltaproteobacteria bacterium ADurb.Bin002]
MRSSISTQSCASVPPAPAWMDMIAFIGSCSLASIILSSSSRTSADRRARSASRSSRSPWSFSSEAMLQRFSVSRMRPLNLFHRSSDSESFVFFCRRDRAFSGSSQKSFFADRMSRSLTRNSSSPTSKTFSDRGDSCFQIQNAFLKIIDGHFFSSLLNSIRINRPAR